MSERNTFEDLKSRVERLENWREGINTRVAVVETDVKTIKETLGKIDSNTTWILRVIIGTPIIGFLGWVVTKLTTVATGG